MFMELCLATWKLSTILEASQDPPRSLQGIIIIIVISFIICIIITIITFCY